MHGLGKISQEGPRETNKTLAKLSQVVMPLPRILEPPRNRLILSKA
jgi:hypothetical protein